MKVNHLLFWMLFSYSSLCAAQTIQIRPEWAAFSTPIKWESPPPELHSKIKSGPVRIRVFFPSGDYGQVGCYAIKQADGSVKLSRGDGDVVTIGRWHQEHDQLVVTSRIVYRTVTVKGRPIPEADIVEKLSFKKGQYWTVWNKEGHYTPLRQFDDWGYLEDLIRCDREYFDGEKHVDGVQPCMPSPKKSDQLLKNRLHLSPDCRRTFRYEPNRRESELECKRLFSPTDKSGFTQSVVR